MPDADDDRKQREHRFCGLYQANFRPIQAYAARRIWAHDDAADVVAEVFTIAWRRLAEIPAPPGDRLWLYGVARRVIGGRNRSTTRLSNLLARLQASHREYEQPPPWDGDPVHTRLLEAVESLRPTEREALKLVLWEQLSHAEAAEVLGVSVNAVGIRVHRAKASLRTALAPGGPPRTTTLPAPPAPGRIGAPSATMPKGN